MGFVVIFKEQIIVGCWNMRIMVDDMISDKMQIIGENFFN